MASFATKLIVVTLGTLIATAVHYLVCMNFKILDHAVHPMAKIWCCQTGTFAVLLVPIQDSAQKLWFGIPASQCITLY